MQSSISYQTLPIVIIAFLEDNSTFISDLLLCFENSVRPSFGYDRQILVNDILLPSRG